MGARPSQAIIKRHLNRLANQNPGTEYRVLYASNGEVAILPVNPATGEPDASFTPETARQQRGGNIHTAKRIIKNELTNWNVSHSRLSAQTVSFSDLARGSRIFVTIHGVVDNQPSDVWKYIENVARGNGFSIEVRRAS
jgi:hypothetical protein